MLLIRQVLAIAVVIVLLVSPPVAAQWDPEGDPYGEPDSIYIVCAGSHFNANFGMSEVLFQLRYFSDNSNPHSMIAFQWPIIIYGSNIVSVDTTVNAAFTGSAVELFDILHVSKEGSPDPTVPPFHMLYGASSYTCCGLVTGESLLDTANHFNLLPSQKEKAKPGILLIHSKSLTLSSYRKPSLMHTAFSLAPNL
jgi:hypothetical protein